MCSKHLQFIDTLTSTLHYTSSEHTTCVTVITLITHHYFHYPPLLPLPSVTVRYHPLPVPVIYTAVNQWNLIMLLIMKHMHTCQQRNEFRR